MNGRDCELPGSSHEEQGRIEYSPDNRRGSNDEASLRVNGQSWCHLDVSNASITARAPRWHAQSTVLNRTGKELSRATNRFTCHAVKTAAAWANIGLKSHLTVPNIMADFSRPSPRNVVILRRLETPAKRAVKQNSSPRAMRGLRCSYHRKPQMALRGVYIDAARKERWRTPGVNTFGGWPS